MLSVKWWQRVCTDPEFLVNGERTAQEVDKLTTSHAMRRGLQKLIGRATTHNNTGTNHRTWPISQPTSLATSMGLMTKRGCGCYVCESVQEPSGQVLARAGLSIVPVVPWEGPPVAREPRPISCQIFTTLFWRLNVQCTLKRNDD